MATITINYTGKDNVYFTLNDGVKDYEWHGNRDFTHTPDQVLFLIRKREYPDANVFVSPADGDIPAVYRDCQTIEEYDEWITANPDVDPVPWTSTHPKEASQEYQDDVVEYKTSPLYGKTYAQLDAIIASRMGDITNIATAKVEIGTMLQIIARSLKAIEKQLIDA